MFEAVVLIAAGKKDDRLGSYAKNFCCLMQAEKSNFKTLFCEKYKCQKDVFARKAVLKCVPRAGAPLVLFLLLVKPKSLKFELETLEVVGSLTSTPSVDLFAQHVKHRYMVQGRYNFVRKNLGVRISGRRLRDLWDELEEQKGRFQGLTKKEAAAG